MSTSKTHRLIARPQITARYLADYMAATEIGKRSIIQDCKFRPIARLVQHDEAKTIIGSYLRRRDGDSGQLREAATELRERMADGDFERELLDHNADYVDRFASVAAEIGFPAADIYSPGSAPALPLNGMKVTVELCCRLRRTTRTNKIRVGAATLRYSKGKSLSPLSAEWQSAFLLGYLTQYASEVSAEPENALCLTIDAYAGVCYPAPTNSVSRFKNMEAACASIAERWVNIQPPNGAAF